MQTTLRSSRPANKGYALIMVMIFLGVTLLVLGSVMFWTSTNAKNIKRNNLYFTSQAAAEAAVEQVIANMNRDYLHQSINSAGSYETNIPSTTNWPTQYAFSSSAGPNTTYVNEGAMSGVLQPLSSQWSGLQGYPENCQVTSTATPQNQLYSVPATVTENVQYADIPLFQFAIFYNMNLEFAPAVNMTITGPVFSNAGIWARANGSSSGLQFSSTVSTAGGVISSNTTDPFSTSYAPSGKANPAFSGGTSTNNPELTLPIGTNNSPAAVEAILQMPPPDNSYTYLYNLADLIITNATSGANIQVFYQDPTNSSALTYVPMDAFWVNSLTHVTNYYYSFVTNASFYDYRETSTAQAIQIDVQKLGVWRTNTAALGGNSFNNLNISDKGKGINSIYVYNSYPLSSSALPAVRLINGQQLPSDGLAVATPDPIYVKGNFNTQTSAGNDANSADVTYTEPAALYGDALTILSSSWNDSYTASTPLASRVVAAQVTINAATLEGIVPSTAANFSGGVENFFRLLENWNGTAFWYNGSIVCMFPSQYATGTYVNVGLSSSYYSAPVRDWAFDSNFTNQAGLPPLTPFVVNSLSP